MEREELIAAQHTRELQDEQARAFAWWALLALFSGGVLNSVPFALAARRTGRRKYRVAALLWLVVAIATVVMLVAGAHGTGTSSQVAGLLIFVGSVGGAAHTMGVRNQYARETTAPFDPTLMAAEHRAAVRRHGRELARRDPAHALELGVGRPDVEGAFDAGLIDVNHVPVAVLERLPGIDATRARLIVELRMNGTGFVSAEDLDMVLDLDPGTLRELAATAVFLPRA